MKINMKTIQQNNIHKTRKAAIVIFSIIFLLILVGVLAYFYTQSNNKITPNSTYTDNNIQTNTQDTNNNLDDKKTPSNNEAPDTDQADNQLSATITAANQNGQILQIRTLVDIIDTNGVCTLTLTGPAEKVVTKTASTQALASSSTCKGFDIPVTELSTGIWKININITAMQKQANLETTITLK